MDFSERIKDSYSFFGKRSSNRFPDWFGVAVTDIEALFQSVEGVSRLLSQPGRLEDRPEAEERTGK